MVTILLVILIIGAATYYGMYGRSKDVAGINSKPVISGQVNSIPSAPVINTISSPDQNMKAHALPPNGDIPYYQQAEAVSPLNISTEQNTNKQYTYDIIDGKRVPPLIIDADYNLLGTHQGTVHVEKGTFTIKGELQGTLDVQAGSKVLIFGKQNGTVSLEKGASVTLYGEINGTTALDFGSVVIVEEGGKLKGTLNNNGKVIIRGIFGGARTGNGELILEGLGTIKQPIIKNGIQYYQ